MPAIGGKKAFLIQIVSCPVAAMHSGLEVLIKLASLHDYFLCVRLLTAHLEVMVICFWIPFIPSMLMFIRHLVHHLGFSGLASLVGMLTLALKTKYGVVKCDFPFFLAIVKLCK